MCVLATMASPAALAAATQTEKRGEHVCMQCNQSVQILECLHWEALGMFSARGLEGEEEGGRVEGGWGTD